MVSLIAGLKMEAMVNGAVLNSRDHCIKHVKLVLVGLKLSVYFLALTSCRCPTLVLSIYYVFTNL